MGAVIRRRGSSTLSGTNYWIAPQSDTHSITAPTYNWIAQQQFYVPVSGFYRFDFPGTGDNEMEFYIDGSINTTAAQRPTITGGQQIGGRSGNFTSVTTFTGGAQLSSGYHTASLVLWDYGGETGALIGSSTFAPAVAYWAPGSGAGGAISYGNGGTITTYSGIATIAAAQSFSNGLKIAGNGTTVFSGTTSLGGGQVVLVDSSNLLVNGFVTSPGAQGIVYVSAGNLGGTGSIYGKIAGSGLVNPGLMGTSSGILAAEQFVATDGLDVTFVFSGTTPNYGNSSNSVNDVLRLTGNPIFTPPFPTSLTSDNTKTLFLNFTKAELTAGTGSVSSLKGGFFTDAAADFASSLFNATWDNGGFTVYVLGDGLGTDNFLNGQSYYNWRNPAMFDWSQSLFLSTVPETANLGSGNVNGQVMLLTVAVPEPSTYAMALAGLACGGCWVWRRRKTPRRSGSSHQPTWRLHRRGRSSRSQRFWLPRSGLSAATVADQASSPVIDGKPRSHLGHLAAQRGHLVDPMPPAFV